ncbi:MAG: protease modulator HflC [Proteobacteria bacterium]|nr:protease modulator HflC [Pseudomonadota bacterium]
MSARLLAPAAAVVALLVVAALSVFVVGEGEFAVRTRFGQVQRADYAPGLHWCWPFERIVRVDRRVLAQRLQAEAFLDSAQQGLSVDIDLGWRVRDPRAYLRAGAAANAEAAVASRLADGLRSRLKAEYAQMSLAQILDAPRGGVSDALLAQLAPLAASLGVELVDARVKRIDPTDQVANAIYARMQEAYASQARELRAAGSAAADSIRAVADRDLADIVAAGNRDAQRLRGEGDAQAAAIRARAYGVNPEFAAFYRSLQAYRNALGHDGDILVIQPDGEFYKYLHNPARR